MTKPSKCSRQQRKKRRRCPLRRRSTCCDMQKYSVQSRKLSKGTLYNNKAKKIKNAMASKIFQISFVNDSINYSNTTIMKNKDSKIMSNTFFFQHRFIIPLRTIVK